MNKLILVLATFMLLSFAQVEPEIAIDTPDDQIIDADGGEIITENIEIEVTTVIPNEPEDTIINVDEVTVVEEVAAPVEDVIIVEENIVVEQDVIVQEMEAPVENINVIEETVIIQEGDEPDEIINVDEVVIVEEAAPVIEEVAVVQEEIIIDETIIVQETAPPVTEVTVVEQDIVINEPDQPDTIISVEEVVIVEENILPGWDIEEGEPVEVGGTVTGTIAMNATVTDWFVNDGKVVPASLALSVMVIGVILIA